MIHFSVRNKAEGQLTRKRNKPRSQRTAAMAGLRTPQPNPPTSCLTRLPQAQGEGVRGKGFRQLTKCLAADCSTTVRTGATRGARCVRVVGTYARTILRSRRIRKAPPPDATSLPPRFHLRMTAQHGARGRGSRRPTEENIPPLGPHPQQHGQHSSSW